MLTIPKIPITQKAFNDIVKTIGECYDIIPEEVVTPNEKYMHIENKKRTATKRKDGRFMAPYTDENGKRKFVYGKTADEALNKAIDKEKAVEDIKVSENYTLASCHEQWFLFKCNQAKLGKLSYGTLDRLETTYNKYLKGSDFEKIDIRTLTEADFVAFLENAINKQGGVTRKEWAKIMQIIKSGIEYCCDKAILKREPFPEFKWSIIKRTVESDCVVNLSSKKAKIITTEEKTALQQAMDYMLIPEKQGSIMAIILNEMLGLRIGELSVLRWDDNIDFNNKVIHVRTAETKAYGRDENGKKTHIQYNKEHAPKTDKSKRDVPMTNEIETLLLVIKHFQIENDWYNEHQYVVYNGREYASNVRALSDDLRRFCEKSGLRNIPSHLIRKAFATNLASCGVPGNVIADILGHESYSTTDEFYILNSEMAVIREHMQRAENLLKAS